MQVYSRRTRHRPVKPSGSPAPSALKLEQTLAQWRHWRCEPPLPGAPHLDHTLEGGLSNHNFLVNTGSQRFVVRIDGVNPGRHGMSRQVEYLAQQSAAKAALAPMPRYFNPELGAMVCDYICPDSQQDFTAADLALLCRKIHALPARRHKLCLGNRFQRYEHLLERTGKPLPPEALRLTIAELLDRVEVKEFNPALCHNDLLPANLIVSKGQLFALDWEYVAMGNPWFDLAVACEGQQYDQGQSENFLYHYLQRRPASSDIRQLQLFSALYRYLELLWHLEQAAPEQCPAVLAAFLPGIEEQLP
ncbi:MAG: phosphotransferase [Halioglobus sp.]